MLTVLCVHLDVNAMYTRNCVFDGKHKLLSYIVNAIGIPGVLTVGDFFNFIGFHTCPSQIPVAQLLGKTS